MLNEDQNEENKLEGSKGGSPFLHYLCISSMGTAGYLPVSRFTILDKQIGALSPFSYAQN
jgi:hypothetical protein